MLTIEAQWRDDDGVRRVLSSINPVLARLRNDMIRGSDPEEAQADYLALRRVVTALEGALIRHHERLTTDADPQPIREQHRFR